LVKDADRRSLPASVFRPLIQPESGTFTNTLTVRLMPTPSPQGPRVEIRYTLDGSEPTARSPAYDRPIALAHSATLKAAAFVRLGKQQIKSETVVAEFKARASAAGGH
jgi:hypothetical protein